MLADENPMNVWVVERATKRARHAETLQSRMPRKVLLRVVAKVIQILLMQYVSPHYVRRSTRIIDPAKVTSHSCDVREHLAGPDARVYSLLEWRDSCRVRENNRRSRRRGSFALLPRIIPRNRTAEKLQVLLRRVRHQALRKAEAALSRQLVSSVIEYISVRSCTMRKYLETMDLSRALSEE
jgi:hypothetical protein